MGRKKSFLRSYLDAGEIDTSVGRAIVAERYTALRRQIPIIYLLALVNLFGLQAATSGAFSVGLNPPTALGLCALVRIVQWFREANSPVPHSVMLRRLKQTSWIAAIACLGICVWCLMILEKNPEHHWVVLLFGSLTAIGAAYGLSSSPAAARLTLLVLAFPLAAKSLLSDDRQFIAAAMSLAVVALLLLRLLDAHNRHFTDLIKSRALIVREQERAEEARLEAIQAATTDFLTSLPNRRAFVATIDAELAKTETTAPFMVAVVDLDRFKPINDTFGHAAGDELLRTVADRLARAVGKQAVVARLGGDEFALIFPKVRDAAGAKLAGRQILAVFEQPATIEDRQFAASACCGLALSSRGKSNSASQVLAHADVALYHAKAQGAGSLALFNARMGAPRRRRSQIERALQLPDVYDKIHLVYQPIVDLRTGLIIAHEALARWSDEELGEVSPAEFVPIAEQLKVIGGLSGRLIESAVREAMRWPASIKLSFNLSAVQLCSEGSVEAILATVRRAKMPPERLQVEVTETALLGDFGKARENLQKLRSQGVTVVLDDFGAGFASIAYLREMQFDQIKLDGSLVTAAQDCPQRQRLLAAVIGLCRALGVSAVAEHIETEEQLKLLLKLGCDVGQGFWLHRPMSAELVRTLSEVMPLLGGGPGKTHPTQSAA